MTEAEYYNRLNWAYPEPLPPDFVKPDRFDPPEKNSKKEKIKYFSFCLENLGFNTLHIGIEKDSDSYYSISVGE